MGERAAWWGLALVAFYIRVRRLIRALGFR